MESTQQPPPPKRLPSLKITSSSTGTSAIVSGSSTHHAASPATPSQGPPKIKLVTSKSQPQTPAGAPPHPTPRASAADSDGIDSPAQPKSGRVSKPSAKKRSREDQEDDDAGSAPPADGTQHQAKKTKITLKPATPGLVRQPTLKVKPVGRIPHKPLGEGYDSEAEDREVDPFIEEQFLFRMLPGEHCEYLRQQVQARMIGVPKAQGGADFQLKWLDEEGRRAVVTVKGQMFAAILLDLPTITEGMKTWDKKSMVKSADICQMLLVFAPVQSEEEAKTAPLPKAVEHGHRWPHGITPPMHDARNRRFRKRLSKLEIKNKEAEVERLLAADREAISSRIEWIDNRRRQGTADEEEEEGEGEDSDEDAEGEADDYFGPAAAAAAAVRQGEEEEEESEVDVVDEMALEAEFLETADTPMVDTPGFGVEGVTPGTANASTPAPQAEEEAAGAEAEGEESEEDGEDEDEEEDEEEEEEGDEDEGKAAIRNEIATLKKQLKSYEDQLAASQQPIMRKRLEGNIRNVKSEILLKMSAIGETEED